MELRLWTLAKTANCVSNEGRLLCILTVQYVSLHSVCSACVLIQSNVHHCLYIKTKTEILRKVAATAILKGQEFIDVFENDSTHLSIF